MISRFFTAMSIGFMLGTGAIVYFMGPEGVRAEVCQGYVENAKSLKISREEKQSYVEKFQKSADGALARQVQKVIAQNEKSVSQVPQVIVQKQIPKRKNSVQKKVKIAETKKIKKTKRRSLSSSETNSQGK